MIIHSHRGLDFGPENTLASFRYALEAGCGLELDVRLTKDKDIVIIHDNDLSHSANVPKTIGSLTVPEIKKYNLFNTKETVPTFDELANTLKKFKLPQDAIAIHLKLAEQTENMMHLLANKIAQHSLENIVFIFDVTRKAIDTLKKENPKIRLAISLGADHHSPTVFTIDDLPEFTDIPIIWWDEWGEANGKKYAETLYTKENLRPLKAKGLNVYAISPDVAYQTNHPLAKDRKYISVWKNMINWKIDGICTDQAKKLIEILKNKQ